MKMIEAVSLKRIVVYPVIVLALLFETWSGGVPVFSIRVLLVYPCLLAAAFVLGEKEIAVTGLVCGILLDFQNLYVGVSAIIFALSLYFISAFLQTFLNRNIFTFIAVSAVAITVYILLCFFFYVGFRDKIDVLGGLLSVALPKTVLSFAVSMLFYGIFAAFRNRFPKVWDNSK